MELRREDYEKIKSAHETVMRTAQMQICAAEQVLAYVNDKLAELNAKAKGYVNLVDQVDHEDHERLRQRQKDIEHKEKAISDAKG